MLGDKTREIVIEALSDKILKTRELIIQAAKGFLEGYTLSEAARLSTIELNAKNLTNLEAALEEVRQGVGQDASDPRDDELLPENYQLNSIETSLIIISNAISEAEKASTPEEYETICNKHIEFLRFTEKGLRDAIKTIRRRSNEAN